MSSSEQTIAYVPVTVSILVPVPVPAPDIPEDAPRLVAGLPVADLDQGTPEAVAVAQAVGESAEIRSALERLLAAVACQRKEYPLTRAVASPWFGTVPEEEV